MEGGSLPFRASSFILTMGYSVRGKLEKTASSLYKQTNKSPDLWFNWAILYNHTGQEPYSD